MGGLLSAFGSLSLSDFTTRLRVLATQKNQLTRCYALNGGKALLLLTYNLGLLSPINKDLFVSIKERESNFRYSHLIVRATVRLRASSQVHGKRARARRRGIGTRLDCVSPHSSSKSKFSWTFPVLSCSKQG